MTLNGLRINNNEGAASPRVSAFHPVTSWESFCSQTASQVSFLATLCKMHVHVLLGEAKHGEVEPAALLSMSGHMVGALAW